jgi:transposase-like protein
MLKEAYQDFKEKGTAIKKAARVHGLPESTFRWRLAKGKSVDVKRGGPTFFTPAQ